MSTAIVARDELADLIIEHIDLVDVIAHALASSWPSHVDRDDLRGAGHVALVECAQRWDHALGVPFEQYARRRIKGAMLDAVRDADWAPRSVRARVRLIENTATDLRHRLRREPTADEIAAATELRVDQVWSALAGVARSQVHSLDTPAGESETTLAELLLCPATGAEQRVEDIERRVQLAGALAVLDDRARTVVVGIYLEGRPLADLADELSVTESRISQIHHDTLRLLNAMLRRHWEMDHSAVPRPGQRRARGYEATLERYREWYAEQRGSLLA